MTAAMTLRIGMIGGNGAIIWLNWQARYDLKIVAAALGDALDRIPLLEAA